MTAPTNQIYVTIGLNQSIFTPYISLTHTFLTDDTTIYGNSLVMDLKIQRGRMHELNRIEAGTATITVNNTDGRFWRYNSASPLYPYFQPLTPIQLYCVYNSTVYPVFTGMIESIQPDWVEDVGGKTSVMKINCVDLLKTLTRYQIYPQGIIDAGITAIATPEMSDVRINECLTYVASTVPGLSGWPAGMANIDTGLVEVSALTYTGTGAIVDNNGMNLLQYLQSVADAESGKLFIDTLGRVTFQNRDFAWTTFASSVETFDTTNTYPYIKPTISDDDTFIYNTSQISYNNNLRTGTDYAMWTDNSYVANQGTRLYQNLDGVIFDPSDAIDTAYVWTERYKDSILRVKSLDIDCDASPAYLYPLMLGHDISTRITLNLNNTDNPKAVPNMQYHVEGITHDWQAWKNCWHTAWQLWDVNQFKLSRTQHDGYLQASGTDYTSVQAQSSANETVSNDEGIAVGQINDGVAPYHVQRAYIEFPSPSLPSGANIIGASVLLHVTGFFVIDNAFDIVLVSPGLVGSVPLTPLINTNYGDLLPDTISLGSLTISTPSINAGWIEIPLNALGLATINKSSMNHFALRSSRDITPTPPPTENEYIAFNGLYVTGTTLDSYRPRLSIQLG